MIEKEEMIELLNEMIERRLVKMANGGTKEAPIVTLTLHGYLVGKLGGWLPYVEREKYFIGRCVNFLTL